MSAIEDTYIIFRYADGAIGLTGWGLFWIFLAVVIINTGRDK